MDSNLPTIGETQPYKYNGKEFDGMYGLNLFDYGARHYDAAIGRWMNMDPLTEGYYNISAYAYVGNNPVPIPNPGTVSIDNTHGAATGIRPNIQYKIQRLNLQIIHRQISGIVLAL